MADLTPDQAIEKLKALPEDKQRAVLMKLSPDERKGILGKLTSTRPPVGQPLPGSPKGTVYTFRQPKEFMQQASQELGEATMEQFEKSASSKTLAGQLGHGALATIPAIGEVATKLAAGLMDWRTAAGLIMSKVHPAIGAAFFGAQGVRGAKEAYDKIQNGDVTPENVQNFLLGLSTAAASGAASGAEGGLSKVGSLRQKASAMMEKGRQGAQMVAGATPERTTAPMVEEYKTKSADAQQRQVEENQQTDAANRQKVEQYHDAKRTAFQKGEEQNAEHALSKEEITQANSQEQARVREINDAAQGQQGRRSELAQSIKQGSQQLGEGIKHKVAEVRAQDNANYAAVREKLASDEGVPMSELAQDARTAEGMLKGTTENIKQFRELIKKAPESEGVETSAGFVKPGDPLFDQLQSEGAIDTGGTIPFDELQGYSSEIGMKLAKGGLPGDVYQALKYLKGKIDAAKVTIAERNGAGTELKNADAFHYNFMDTFYDKPSAVAASLDRVGKLDPEFYAEPFITGKAGQTGIAKLQRFDPKLAELATSLRKSHEEFSALPKQAKTVAPKLKPEPSPPSPIEPPKRPELKAPKKIEQPAKLTIEDVRGRKAKEVKASAREIGRLSRYDAAILASSAVGPFLGRWETLLIDPAYLVGRKAIGRMLDRPAVQRWLSEPSPEDIRILNSLPPEAKTEVQGAISDYAASHSIKTLSPEARRFLGQQNVARILAGAGTGANIPQTPGEARERMRAVAPQ
jgi:hypothetical protein